MLAGRIKLIENYLFAIMITVVSVITAFCNIVSENIAESTFSEQENESLNCAYFPLVVIDPGHGGADCGAVGINGALEKDVNLQMSLKLADLLTDAGYNVKLTRSEDVMLTDSLEHSTKKESDLAARANLSENGCIYISIHMNKFIMPEYSGLQVYYSENHPRSKLLATTIQKNVKSNLQTDNNREIKPGGELYLLKAVKEICVLVECGYIIKKEEAQKISDRKFQNIIANAIAKGCEDYLKETFN